MDKEKKKKERSVVRRLFSKNVNEIEECLDQEHANIEMIQLSYQKLKETADDLLKLDKVIKDLTLEDLNEEELEKELESCLNYKTKWLHLDMKYKAKISKIQIKTDSHENCKNMKLPKLQLQNFDGEIKSWLPFWGQFSKIHNDKTMDDFDKHQYLLQCMKENTEVRRLVESFPPTAYTECIDQLTTRYAREDLLIQIYIREILSLILMEKKDSITLLFDKLNAHLRALQTLKVTADKYAAFLLPMVESALPQDLIKAWERSKDRYTDVAGELNGLLEFLRKEVESEQRIKISRKTFKQEENVSKEIKTSTAECLVTNVKPKTGTNKTQDCIWCDKETHASIECYKMQKMNLEQRRQCLKDKKACVICLRKGHHAKVCRASVKCLICKKRHSTALCSEQKLETGTKNDDKPESATSLSALYPKGETLLQTVIVDVEYMGRTMKVRVLLDSGSQRTYIKEEIIDTLKIPTVGKERLTHCLFGGVETKSKEYKIHNVTIQSLNDSSKYDIMAISQTSICGNIPKVNSNDVQLKNILHEHGITLTDKGNNITDVGILIGADHLGLFLTGSLIQLKNGLVAVKTRLGWTLQGKQVSIHSVNSNCNLTNVLHCCTCDLTDYWSLETLGIRDPVEVKSRAETTKEVLDTFEENVILNQNNRYEVQLPFKTNVDSLLPNYNKAKQRLDQMTRKLIKTDKFHDYDKIFKSWTDLGIIEATDSTPNSGHYLPHRPVIKEQSITSNIRPVFDASATDKNGLSLNACLEKGDNLIDLIPDMINNFRTGAIGITADIEKAFLQISLKESDREYLKFLWYEDDTLQNIITYRHCRVVFGLTSSPFLLSATLQYHLNNMKNGPLGTTAKLMTKSFYVDNCLVSVNSKESAGKFISEAKTIMNTAKFNLRMWVTSQGVNETGNETISVLGLKWNPKTDKLYCNCYNLPTCEDLQSITKRSMLSLTQKIFDPIGFISPVLLTPKVILQDTWLRKLEWDDELPSDLRTKFLDWYKYISYLNDCHIPRRLTTDNLQETQVSLHLFCDASKYGCGMCVLLRTENNGKVSVQLVAAKSRVNPPKMITIPRLELTAALLGSRLIAHVRENLQLNNCQEYCWTDSGVTLCWIKRQLPLNTFVGNRVKEIRINTDTKNWQHIPGEANWADLASRGCNAKTLYECRWWEGPEWLRRPSAEWPRSALIVDEREVSLEVKKTVCNTNISEEQNLLNMLQNYFSKYSQIVRMTAWLLRFIHNVKYACNKKTGEITYREVGKAEKVIIKLIQENNSELLDTKKTKLTTFIDKEGLIRLKTKLLLSDLPEGIRTPYLLPAKEPIVTKMVRQRHVELQHAGTNQLITDIRMRYWVIGIRRLVRSIITSCPICNRYKSKPTQAPTAPLPLERITCSAPFQTTGVDLAGPFYLRGEQKCWVVLYTCAVYRAVHLELTRSLSTEAFIMTLRRFIARRGRVDMLVSDQGTNFHGTKNLLDTLNWGEIQQQSTIRRIHWKMNAPSAAWWGGYWERLIGIMKELLKRILGKACVTYEELLTIICDCEAVMNGRPLTYVTDDKGECLEPLTPSYFIQPMTNSDVTDFDEIDTNNLNNRLKYIQTLRDQFRQRFKSEYLCFLVQKGHEKKDIINIGDIVLIETDGKRIKWPMGIVTEMITGADGVQRTAIIKTSTGEKTRPVQRLYKLEISGNNPPIKQESDNLGIPTMVGKQSMTSSDTAGDTGTQVEVPIVQKSTRCGRKVKLPSKFDLYV